MGQGLKKLNSVSITQRDFVKALLLAIAGIACAWVSARTAVANVSKQNAPPWAVGALSGVSMAERARIAILSRPSASPEQLKVELQNALRRDPVNPAALQGLALIAALQKDGQRSLRLLTLSETYSRRDVGTQLLLIEHAVQANDLNQALVHYDRALRSGGQQASVILMPILAASLDEKNIRAGFGRLVRDDPPWLVPFITYVYSTGQGQRGLAQALVLTGRPNSSAELDDAIGRLIFAISSHDAILARRLALRFFPARARAIDDPSLSNATTYALLRPLTWNAVDRAGVGASLSEDGRSIQISANANERGAVLQRIIFLTPGQYRISARLGNVIGGGDAGIGWKISCGSKASAPIFSEQLQPPKRSVIGVFAVTGLCPAQLLELLVAASGDQSGMTADVSKIDIQRIETQ